MHDHYWEYGDAWSTPGYEDLPEGDYEVLICDCGEYRWKRHTHE